MLTKRKLKNKVRVIFTLPAHAGDESVRLVGDFNNWDQTAMPMARNKDGDWEVKLDLEPDQEFQFRYLVNGRVWRNDPAADGFVRNPFGSENSLVSTKVVSGAERGAKRSARPKKQKDETARC
jgi:1,4-alpha-glucan branching enzyme